MAADSDLRPLQPVRRFDVFAESKRLEAQAHGEPEDVVKGYGIRIAKIVASRKFGGAARKSQSAKTVDMAADASPGSRFAGEDGVKFRSLAGELQTNETFDREIIERMGPEFHEIVFQPAIRDALAESRKYERFRDTIRKNWKPARG